MSGQVRSGQVRVICLHGWVYDRGWWCGNCKCDVISSVCDVPSVAPMPWGLRVLKAKVQTTVKSPQGRVGLRDPIGFESVLCPIIPGHFFDFVSFWNVRGGLATSEQRGRANEQEKTLTRWAVGKRNVHAYLAFPPRSAHGTVLLCNAVPCFVLSCHVALCCSMLVCDMY